MAILLCLFLCLIAADAEKSSDIQEMVHRRAAEGAEKSEKIARENRNFNCSVRGGSGTLDTIPK
jgi:hypothetical protein